MTIQFWILTGSSFKAREAKRLFSLIGSGAAIANSIIGFSMSSIINSFGTDILLPATSAFIGFATITSFISRKYVQIDNRGSGKAIIMKNSTESKSKKLIPSKYLKIINDSKSTTLSSTVPFLESNEKILWILGGLFKKGDKFNLNKKYFKNLEAYIYGKDRQVFLKLFKNKIKVNLSKDLRNTLKLIPNLKDIRTKVTVLFSPSAASFDQYKNFEERGRQFNMLIKRYLPIE